MAEVIDTVIIGAGHAGLALSYYLTRNERQHIVLERGNVAERWRSERWDSLVFQLPNWSLQLPGRAYQGSDPDGYASKDEFIRFLEDYASIIRAPVRCGTEVVGLREAESRRSMILETTRGVIEAKNVVVATGPFRRERFISTAGASELLGGQRPSLGDYVAGQGPGARRTPPESAGVGHSPASVVLAT